MKNIYMIAAMKVKLLRKLGMSRADASAKVSAAMNSASDYESAVRAIRAVSI